MGPILYIIYYSPMHEIAETIGNSDHYFADDSKENESFIPSPATADHQRTGVPCRSGKVACCQSSQNEPGQD